MRRHHNPHTQPRKTHPVFDNWDVVVLGWYAACPSGTLARGEARKIELCGHHLVLFRGEDGRARALDAYCPHMGTHLGIGTVVGNTIRCFFHQWRFDGDGRCVDVPCGEAPPAHARAQPYAVEEKYGFVWVYPEAVAPHPVPGFDELDGVELMCTHDPPIETECHHHVSMVNGIDAQHLATVHGIRMGMDLVVTEHPRGNVVDYVLRGEVPRASVRGRLIHAAIGGRYAYAMRYVDANLGLLTTVRDVRLFGTGPRVPSLHMIFAYSMLEPGRIRVQPIYVARRRAGPWGWAWTWVLLTVTRLGYYGLRGGDRHVYANIRFHSQALLPLDGAVGRFIAWTNRLKPSRWSRAWAPDPTRPAGDTGD